MDQINSYLRNHIFKAPQVLAIDRDEDNLLLVYQTLEIFGYSCILTQDLQKTLDLASLYQPCLILLEISTNHSEDIKILRSLKENLQTCHIPVIGLTTFTQAKECQTLLDLGCVSFLRKPYLISDLGQIVTPYMSRTVANTNLISSFLNSSECTA